MPEVVMEEVVVSGKTLSKNGNWGLLDLQTKMKFGKVQGRPIRYDITWEGLGGGVYVLKDFMLKRFIIDWKLPCYPCIRIQKCYFLDIK